MRVITGLNLAQSHYKHC